MGVLSSRLDFDLSSLQVRSGNHISDLSIKTLEIWSVHCTSLVNILPLLLYPLFTRDRSDQKWSIVASSGFELYSLHLPVLTVYKVVYAVLNTMNYCQPNKSLPTNEPLRISRCCIFIEMITCYASYTPWSYHHNLYKLDPMPRTQG